MKAPWTLIQNFFKHKRSNVWINTYKHLSFQGEALQESLEDIILNIALPEDVLLKLTQNAWVIIEQLQYEVETFQKLPIPINNIKQKTHISRQLSLYTRNIQIIYDQVLHSHQYLQRPETKEMILNICKNYFTLITVLKQFLKEKEPSEWE